jgi:predicted nucleic-acid-binding protein
MAAIDTNVLVRFLIQDDEQQSHLAKSLIHQLLAEGETLFIAVTVLLELEWVLRSNFLFNKSQIIELLSNLLSTQELKFESESSVEIALELFRNHPADFADCLHISLAHRAGHSPLWTFDKTASKVLGAKLLK